MALTIFDEACHLLMANVFGNDVVTPTGWGPTLGGLGETGWSFELDLIGGVILAEWSKGNTGKMREMLGLVIQVPAGQVCVISERATGLANELS